MHVPLPSPFQYMWMVVNGMFYSKIIQKKLKFSTDSDKFPQNPTNSDKFWQYKFRQYYIRICWQLQWGTYVMYHKLNWATPHNEVKTGQTHETIHHKDACSWFIYSGTFIVAQGKNWLKGKKQHTCPKLSQMQLEKQGLKRSVMAAK